MSPTSTTGHHHVLRLRLRPSDTRRAETSSLRPARPAADLDNGTTQHTPSTHHSASTTTPGSDERLSPIPTIVAGRLFAAALAGVWGIDPEHPRGLTKVARTT